MPVHASIAHADTHEPKHITISTTADTGKVITPSSTLNGASELRNLAVSEISGLPAAIATLGTKVYSGKTVNNNATAMTFSVDAVDATFQTAGDYAQITGIFESPEVSPSAGVTRGTDTLTIVTTGVYRIDFWSSVKSDTNLNQIAINFGLAGVPNTARSLVIRAPNNTDPFIASVHSMVPLTAGDVISLWMAAKKASDITLMNGRLSLELIEAT